MTHEEIQAVIDGVERDHPGLRATDRFRWTNRVAEICYGIDHTVGQKRADAGRPVSDDTIAILAAPLRLQPGEQMAIRFEAVDLINGASGALQWLSHGSVDQIFVCPTPTGLSGGGGVLVPPHDDVLVCPNCSTKLVLTLRRQ